jgi:hypothetical protein
VNDDSFERLLALNPTVVDSAKAVAAGAVAAMPSDLLPSDEPAHVFRAVSSGESERGA